MVHRYALLIGLFLVAATASAAPAPQQVPAGAIKPIPPVTAPPELTNIGPEHAVDCLLIYQDENPAPTQYYDVGVGIEVADDLHTTAADVWGLCAFDIGYFSPGGPTDIRVTFYDDNAVDDPPGAITGGPYVLAGAPPGANFLHVEVASGTVGPDTWMGVTFGTAGAGLIFSNPVTVGSSHDYYFQTPPAGYFYFGGNPRANFWLGAYASPPVQNRVSTWGQVKGFYR